MKFTKDTTSNEVVNHIVDNHEFKKVTAGQIQMLLWLLNEYRENPHFIDMQLFPNIDYTARMLFEYFKIKL